MISGRKEIHNFFDKISFDKNIFRKKKFEQKKFLKKILEILFFGRTDCCCVYFF